MLGDPHVAERIGAAALNVNVGGALEAVIAGTRLTAPAVREHRPRQRQVQPCPSNGYGRGGRQPRAARNRPVGDTPLSPYHPCDCDYNVGLLSRVPVIFGGPAARISHPRCIGRGDHECIFDVHWSPNGRPTVETAATAGALLLLAGCVLFVPSLIPVAIVLASVIAIVAGTHAIGARRSRTRLTQTQLREQAEVTDLLMTSMQDLVSALRLDEVLEKITQRPVGRRRRGVRAARRGRRWRWRAGRSGLPERARRPREVGDGHAELAASTLVEDLPPAPSWPS